MKTPSRYYEPIEPDDPYDIPAQVDWEMAVLERFQRRFFGEHGTDD